MLIGEEGEELVLDDGTTNRAAGNVAVQLRNLVALGNVRILIEEEWGGVEPACSTVNIGCAVKNIRAGGGAEIDVRAGCRTLLRVIHGSVHADFRDGLGRGRGDGVADGQVNGGSGLDDSATAAWAGLDAGRVDDARGGDLAGAFAVEEIAGVNAIQQKRIRSVALAIGPDGRVSETGVCAGSSAQLCGNPRGLGRKTGKTPGGQRHRFNLRFVHDVTYRGVHGVHQRRAFHFDGFALGCGNFQLRIERCRAVGLHGDMGRLLNIEVLRRVGKRIGTDGQVHKRITA